MKLPSISHFPWSPGMTKDDTRIISLTDLQQEKLWFTEKLDGECTSFHSDKCHARSEDSLSHPSQSWVKSLQAQIAHRIPTYLQIVGENVYAKHSIYYDQLTSFFYVIMIIDKMAGRVLSRGSTDMWCNQLGLRMVPTLYEGTLELCPLIKTPRKKSIYGSEIEGYVGRVADEFSLHHFSTKIAKYVRAGHVKTDEHWRQSWIPNKLRTLKGEAP